MSNDTVRLLNDLGFDHDVTTDILSEDMEGDRPDGPGPAEWVSDAIMQAMMKKVAPRLLPGETYAFKADGLVYTVRNGVVYCGGSVLRKNAKFAEWPKLWTATSRPTSWRSISLRLLTTSTSSTLHRVTMSA